MTTEKGNKLIAEFMGYKFGYPSENDIEDFIYHKSWDWLMPVVKKIQHTDEKLLEKDTPAWHAYHGMYVYLELADIQRVWQQCIEFIKSHTKDEKIRI